MIASRVEPITPPALAPGARVRALGLLSGGLDSALATKILLDQGLDVIGLHLESPTACRSDVHAVASELGIPLVVRAKGDAYVRLLRHPHWGYGRHMNPCIDCRHFMFGIGAACLEEFGAQFLFTGEVLGQRPMSQTRNALELIDRAAGMAGWIVRPLSAALLDPTEPERREWIDRGRLFAIAGRGRQLQLELATRWKLTQHQSPGGGCLLTDMHYSNRLRDLFDHTAEDETSIDDLALLRLGRHVRVRPDLKVVLGRDREENQRLAGFESPQRWCLEPVGFTAPTALVCGARSEANIASAIELIVRYSRQAPDPVEVRWRDASGHAQQRVQALGRAAGALGASPVPAVLAPAAIEER